MFISQLDSEHALILYYCDLQKTMLYANKFQVSNDYKLIILYKTTFNRTHQQNRLI
jgi:hypothetical protein